MKIENNNNTAFCAKFFHTESLKSVAEYAAENGKFGKLNQARKNIDCAYLDRRLKFELFVTEDDEKIPYVILTRFTPKDHVIIPKSINDYKISEPFIYIANRRMNPLKYGYDLIRKLGNGAPENKMFRSVVAGAFKK